MPDAKEKAVFPPRYSDSELDAEPPVGFQSSGVARIEAIANSLTYRNRIFIFTGMFLSAICISMDISLRTSYQAMAASSMKNHSLLSTINTIRDVVGVVTLPCAAKIADTFGRTELLAASIAFYFIGTIVEASSRSIPTFAVGAVFYQLGYSLGILLLEIIIADTTSLRSRVFFAYIPPFCYVIVPWVVPEIFYAVTKYSTWRWGIGMWAIIYPICSIWLIASLCWVSHKANKAGRLKAIKTPYQQYGGWSLMKVLFWQLDVIGIIFLTSALSLTLVPLTLAGGKFPQPPWSAATIVPTAVGILTIPLFLWWETKAPHPMIPFHLLKDRGVWGALGIALHLNFAFSCQSDYLFSVLRIAFNESERSATRITSLYSFVSVVTGVFMGLVVFKVRRLKPFIMLGTCIYLAAFCLLIYYRGGATKAEHVGIVVAQVVLGIGGGLFPYPALASIQAATKHEHLAVITGLYLACFTFGSALGTQLLPRELGKRLGGNTTLAEEWYAAPLELIPRYPPGTPERQALIEAFRHIQQVLCIAGLHISVALVFFSVVLRNPRLPDTQSMPEAADGAIEMTGSNETPEVSTNGSKKKWAFWK